MAVLDQHPLGAADVEGIAQLEVEPPDATGAASGHGPGLVALVESHVADHAEVADRDFGSAFQGQAGAFAVADVEQGIDGAGALDGNGGGVLHGDAVRQAVVADGHVNVAFLLDGPVDGGLDRLVVAMADHGVF